MAENIRYLKDGSVMASTGPMFLNILVVRKGHPDTRLAESGIRKGFSLLEELVKHRTEITTDIKALVKETEYPPVVRKMISVALLTGEKGITPLIAVAGSVSEEIAEFIAGQGDFSKIMVNNGGDIAIRLKGGETANVGINLDCSTPDISHVLTLKDDDYGIATSGLGGRSFTKGIASSAVVLAKSASLADVLATLLGNATNADDPLIERRLSHELYVDTDIPNHWVTVSVGDITEEKMEEALSNGMAYARGLRQRGLEFETLLAVKGRIRATGGMEKQLRSLENKLT